MVIFIDFQRICAILIKSNRIFSQNEILWNPLIGKFKIIY